MRNIIDRQWKGVISKVLLAAIFFLFSITVKAQKINGQWRGYFNSSGDIVLSGGDHTEYVLELEIKGSVVSGYSYSYFQNRKYYVICSLGGTYYKSTKSMKVTETARIKGFTPPDWSDCLQTHLLTYNKEKGNEELAGRWVSAEGQLGDCGKGLTTLKRRTITNDLSSYNKPGTGGSPFSAKKIITKKPLPLVSNKKPAPPVVKNSIKPTVPVTKPPVAKTTKPINREIPGIIVPEKKTNPPSVIVAPNKNFEKRSTELIKTIEITNGSFQVDLYDNGDVDGDSVSLFYNNVLLIARKKLTEKPITLTLNVAADNNTNELTMYAENLGVIPPNTALMVIKDGDKRYEVRIASDLKKSGTIRFVYRPSNGLKQ